MLIRELKIENFRKFRQPVHLSGFGSGLNLVCEPNEVGKSTVLEAIRAVLFERHGAKGQKIKSFRPHGDEVGPAIELVFEVDGKTWSLKKKFLQGASVLLEGPAGRYQSDEAEEKLQALLGFSRAGNTGADDDSRGALGLLWVEQGQSFVLEAPGQQARKTFEDVLAGEVGAVTGGKRAVAVMESVRKDLAELLTATGKPTKRLAQALETAQEARSAAHAAEADLALYEDVLTRLESKRGELRRVLRDLSDEDERTVMEALRKDIERAKTAAQLLQTATLVWQQAVTEHERLEEQANRRTSDQAALASAVTGHANACANQAAHQDVSAAAKAHVTEAEGLLKAARAAVRDAEAIRTTALKARFQAETLRAKSAAFTRLDKAEAVQQSLEGLAAQLAAERMDAKAAQRLEELARKRQEAKTSVEAGAATIALALSPSAQGVTLDGVAVTADQSFVLSARRDLEAPGLGRLTMTPPASGETARARLRAAEADMEAFLEAVGHTDMETARAAARARTQMQAEEKSLTSQLAVLCPADPALKIAAGYGPLRAALAGQERPADADVDPEQLLETSEAAEAAYQQARAEEEAQNGRMEAALEDFQKAQLQETRLSGLVEQAAAAVDRLQQIVTSAQAEISDQALADNIAQAATKEAQATVDLETAKRTARALDLTGLERKLEAANRRQVRLAEERLELVSAVAKLEEQAKTQGGQGPAMQAQGAVELAEVAEQQAQQLRDEADVLALLKETLEGAQTDASRKYLAPITKRIAPFVRRLLPNASLNFHDDFRPSTLLRSGREEAAEDLSKGTQEQIAILTRLAFADLLLSKGKPASLILDDALVFADDDRFETMTEILSEAAKRMQVIILSCRSRAFRHLDATRLSLGG
jgi:DNA repair exonuclease SbcCD ATPase subunit